MLNEFLLSAWAEGRRQWPQVDLPNHIFVSHVTQLLTTDRKRGSLVPTLKSLDSKGLYLACACVHGVPKALPALEKHYLAKLPTALGSLKLAPTELDDICQEVRKHLLMSTPKSGPKLAGYTGRGALLTWMRVMAARMALKPGSVAHVPLEESEVEALLASGMDLEREFDMRLYGPQFREAFREALAGLPKKQRALLRFHLHKWSEKEMAAYFGKHQTTISRWLEKVRERLYKETKRRLQERMGLTSWQFKSLTNALKSHFDMSLSQYLADGEEEKGGN